MSPDTRAWLALVEQLGEQARKEMASGGDAQEITTRLAHASVEPPGAKNCERLADDLRLPRPKLWSDKQSARFDAEVEVWRFAKSVIGEMARSVA